MNKCEKAEPEMPEPVMGKMVPTLNGFGYMTVGLDAVSEQFASEAGRTTKPVLEIGAAYGNTALRCLENGARVFANDIDARHLRILERRARERGLAANLTLLPGSVPRDVALPREHFALVLACRVLHFFEGTMFEEALSCIHRSLLPGGKFFVVLDTPYNKYFSAMIPPFVSRRERKSKWPGQFVGKELPEFIKGYDLERYPNVYNLFDIETLHDALTSADFEVERVTYVGRPDYLDEGQMDGRECVAAIASKRGDR